MRFMGYCDQTLLWQTYPFSVGLMFYKNISTGRGLNRRDCRPRLVESIIKEMFRGQSPLAKGYRKHFASSENSAEKGGER